MMWVSFGLAVAVAVAGVLIFNRLVAARQLVRNGWSDIDVQLKRRAELIPQLVATVRGYAAHERDLFETVAEQRSAALMAGAAVSARAQAESAMARGESRILAIAEDYPELKASENFLGLQTELSDTEEKIEMARRFYNGATREFNTAIAVFPNNLLAGPLGFREAEYFETDVRQAPEVDLST